MKHTRGDVIMRTSKEFEDLERLVRKLGRADWRRPVPRPETKDPWTVKDSLAHIVHWKEHTARVLRQEKRPLELRGLEVNAINRLIYERWKGRPPTDVLAWHRRVHDEVMQTLRTVPSERFTRREHGPDWPGDFTSHSAWHRARDIAAALQ
ncbi:MAG TPA: maleylpyruvate isomerase N-terminal domain-containing protein [Candidatus Dormibacteraeota bacterium]